MLKIKINFTFVLLLIITLYSNATNQLNAADQLKIKGIKEISRESIMSEFKMGEAIDTSRWHAFTGGQNCKSTLKRDPKNNRTIVDFSFSGKPKIEYMAIGAPLKITAGNQYIGVRTSVRTEDGQSPLCPYCMRLIDPSGETHQINLNLAGGDWLLGEIKSSSPHWGGDENGILEFPCTFDCLIMDKADSNWKKSGQFTLYDIRFFDRHPIQEMADITIPAIVSGSNISSSVQGSETLEVHIVPKNEFKSIPFEIHVQKQINDKILPGKFIQPDSNGRIKIERCLKTGFESIILTPVTKDKEGKRIFDKSVKYSFAVLPKIENMNRWFGTTTHLNFPCIGKVPQMGMGMIRDEFYWGNIERKKGEFVYNTDRDRYYTLVKDLGIDTLVILDYANSNYDGGNFPHTDEGIAGFAEYCGRMAAHLKGRCRYYEIWNEWSGACGMSQFVSKGHHNTPENYVKLLKAASEAVRKADPNAYIIGGGGDHHVSHFKQIEEMMKLGVMKYCDAFSVHPYVYPRTPEDATVRENLQKVIDIMRANGCAHPKLWLTELGWPTYSGLSRDPAIAASSFTLENYGCSLHFTQVICQDG